MKKVEWKKLAIIGISTGMLATLPLAGATKTEEKKTTQTDVEEDDSNLGYHLMTEDELFLQLSPKGIKMYKELSQEGKGLALLVASQRCNASNPCKALNACQSSKNTCAGKGECKGQGKCAFSDKDLAVKVVSDKMAQKRSGLTK